MKPPIYEYQRINVYAADVPKTSVSLDWDTYFGLMAKLPVKSHKAATKLIRDMAISLHRAGHDGTLSNATRVAVLQALRS